MQQIPDQNGVNEEGAYQFCPVSGLAAGPLMVAMQQRCFEATGERLWNDKAGVQLLGLPGARLFLVQVKNNPVGFAFYLCASDQADLISVGILPEIRGTGLAYRLLKDCQKALKKEGICQITLEVRHANESARGLYEKLGYKTVGRRKNYYHLKDGSRMDAILYQLVLTPG